MPVSAATLSKLIAAGLSGQELIDVVASIDADMDSNPAPKKRSAGAIRQERYRERKDAAKRMPEREWLPIVGQVIARDGGACVYCGTTEKLGVDHVIPLSRGGTDDLSNLAACCESCNKSKGGRTVEEWKNGIGGRHGDVTRYAFPLSDKEKSPTPPKEINYPPSSLRSETKRATRLPADWSLPSTWGQWALQQGHSEAHIRLEAEKFRDFWCSKSGKDATKVDWLATWRNWIRNSKPAAHRGQAPPPRMTHHQQRHHDALKAVNEFIGINDDEPEFAGSTFDLDPGDFRSH